MPFPRLLLIVALEALALLLLSRLLFVSVIAPFANRRGKGPLLGLLRLPGNLLHEFSHCLGFWLSGYRVRRIILCVFDPQGRGACEPGPAWAPFTFPQLAIGLSALMPMLLGSLALVLLTRLLEIPAPPPLTPRGDLWPLLGRQSLQLLHALDFQRWQTYLFLYLTLSIGAELAPSASDLRYAAPTIIGGALCAWLTLFALSHVPSLHAWHHAAVLALSRLLLRFGAVLSLTLVLLAATAVIGLGPSLIVQALRGPR